MGRRLILNLAAVLANSRGRVDVDGTTADEPGLSISPDASIELHADRPIRRRVRTRLLVLYEDDDVLVVDKPAGLLTVPTEARDTGRILNLVARFVRGVDLPTIARELERTILSELAPIVQAQHGAFYVNEGNGEPHLKLLASASACLA